MAALKAHNSSTEKARYLRVDTPETSFLELHWQSVQSHTTTSFIGVVPSAFLSWKA